MGYEFIINKAPYHFEVFAKKSKEWEAYSNHSRHPLRALMGKTSSSKSKGEVRYHVGNSIRVRHARFEETWLNDVYRSTRTLDIKLGMPPKRQIHLETYCDDRGSGGITELSARKRTGLFSWQNIPVEFVNSP